MILTLVLIPIVALMVAAVLAWSVQYRRVGPNQVLIVSGRKTTYVDPISGDPTEKNFAVYHGGGTLVLPLRERVDTMSVELMTLEIRTPEFFTRLGVPIVVDAIAQIRVRADSPFAIATAAEMFLGKSEKQMNEIAHQMMQGHLRAVISTMTFEGIHAEPEAFADQVQRLTARDLDNMGIEVVSFTIREVQDPDGYLEALGRPQLAEAKKRAELGEAGASRDARVGQAEAKRTADITAARARQESERANIEAELVLARAQAERDREVFAEQMAVAEAKAKSDAAYALQKAKNDQLLAEQTVLLQKLRIEQQRQELVVSVEEPAEAERRRIECLAEAERARGLAEAEVIRARGAAEAEVIRQAALAEADGMRARLLAEAEGMDRKAEAWKQYGAAALHDKLVEQLPAVASAVAAPLAQIERIVLVGGNEASGVGAMSRTVADVISQLPAVVEATTGLDLAALRATSIPKPENEPLPSAAE